MPSLYRCWSPGDDLDYPGRSLLWVPLRAERIRLAAYSELIEEIEGMASAEASIAKGYIDEFFTLSELNLIEECIQRSGRTTLFHREYPVPLVCRDSAGSALVPLRCRGLEEVPKTDNPTAGLLSFLPYDVAGYLLTDKQISKILG